MQTQILKIYDLFLQHPVVSTDSRNIPAGSIFFALKGETFNGNEFAREAIRSGAAYAVVDEPEYAAQEAILLVDDVLSCLQELATHHRLQFNIPVIAITGTNGKTTTKELINIVLSKKYRTLATTGNLNNHIGVPLTLLRLTNDTEVAVIEMGANHPGEIDLLCRIANPGYGLITNIGKAHLEGFGGYDGVISTKTELYRFIQNQGGLLFLNQDDELLSEKSAGIPSMTYGSGQAYLGCSEVKADPCITATLKFKSGSDVRVTSELYGIYNLPNLLAAACIGQYFNVPEMEIIDALEAYQPGNNRSQLKHTEKNLLILDAYNANPTSMKAALDAFAAASYTEKTVILGDMLELGKDTDNEHLEIIALLEQHGFSEVFLIGPVFTRLNTRRENICFQDSDLAGLWFEHHRMEGRTMLIKGSRGIHLEKLTPNL